MAKLAIKGHATRGREIIELLEMLGGKNFYNWSGSDGYAYYVIEGCQSKIRAGEYIFGDEDMYLFTLEEFLEKYPFKLGDSVKNDFGSYGKVCIMKWMNDEILYRLDFGHSISGWYGADQLFPVEEKESMKTITIDDFKANTKEWLIDKLHGMIISDVVKTIGDIHDELHKPRYPKTYEECCVVLDLPMQNALIYNNRGCNAHDYYYDLRSIINVFVSLKMCRDAYWKIEEDWKPDWNNISDKHCIYVVGKEIWLKECQTRQCTLAFPTAEMRDAFYENFKGLIEQCKELL